MMPYLARVTRAEVQVYALRESRLPRVWRYISYQQGVAAIDDTPVRAIAAALRELNLKNLTKGDKSSPK